MDNSNQTNLPHQPNTPPTGAGPVPPRPAGPTPAPAQPIGPSPARPQPNASGPGAAMSGRPLANPAMRPLANQPSNPLTTAPGATSQPTNSAAPHAPSMPGLNLNTPANTPGFSPSPGQGPQPDSGQAASLGQTPAPDPNQGSNPNSAPAAQPKNKKTLYIVLGCLAGVVVIACIAAAVFFLLPKEDSTPAEVPSQSVQAPVGLTPIEDLDKDGLIAAADNMSEPGYLPEDYVEASAAEYVDGHNLILTDSYADVDELSDRTYGFSDTYEANVQEFADSYALIAPVDETGNIPDDAEVYLAFNENYLVAEEDPAVESGEYTPVVAFVDTSEEFIKTALPLLVMSYTDMPFSTIYDFDVTADETTATLDLYTISYVLDSDGTLAAASDASDTSTSDDSTSDTSTSNTSTNRTKPATGNAAISEPDESSSSGSSDESSTTAQSKTNASATGTEETSPYFIVASHIQIVYDFETGEFTTTEFDETGSSELINAFALTEEEYEAGSAKN